MRTNLGINKICVHFHLFKNAGTTVDWSLKRNFGNHFFSMDDGKEPRGHYSAKDVNVFLRNHPLCRALSSHKIKFPLPENKNWEFIPIVFIRNPIDRIMSVYQFEKRQKELTPGSKMAKKLDLKQYIHWRLQDGYISVITGFQTFYLSWYKGIRAKGRTLCDKDFNRAIKQLQSCSVVGVVERMEESMLLAEIILKRHFNGIDMSFVGQNVTIDRKDNIEDRINMLKDEIGPELFSDMFALNKYDIALHEYTNKLLTKQIEDVPNWKILMEEFRSRCRLLKN